MDSVNVSRQVSTLSNMSVGETVDDCDFDDYYNFDDVDASQDHSTGNDTPGSDADKSDPENFKYDILDVTTAKEFLRKDPKTEVHLERSRTLVLSQQHRQVSIKSATSRLTSALSETRSCKRKFGSDDRVESMSDKTSLKKQKTEFKGDVNNGVTTSAPSGECLVCFDTVEDLKALECGHSFCANCWNDHVTSKINDGICSRIQCMDPDCTQFVTEEFVAVVLTSDELKQKFDDFLFQEKVVSHTNLRFCPGADCQRVVRVRTPLARRVKCDACTSVFCFECGLDYHAPVQCSTIKSWIQKCEDDSETANYLAANTKDCPKCNVYIEKSGGCNHMVCRQCDYDFCWMCREPWDNHENYYECSKYKENEDEAKKNEGARVSLEKYLFYFSRWQNHTESQNLEAETRAKITSRIEHKVGENEGTWIDWECLLKACDLLEECRHTLKYTYPYAYYLEAGGKKECFEHIQAQLESEVEKLSWRVERAEITDRAELERQMNVTKTRKQTLLQDFL